MASAPPALELVDLRRRYGAQVALDGLTFAVPAAGMFGLLGPNGAGKSTAMRIVMGVLRPDSGEVRWRGRPVGEAERRRFGYLPEQRGLYARMRIRDHLVYLARLHGLARAAAARAADELLERLGLGARAGDRVDALSHGNGQRVQLAASMIHDPDLLILDEPFSGLDPLAVETLAELLRERAAAGRTVVFSSHQLDLVEGLCESVAIVAAGRVVVAGMTETLKRGSHGRLLRIAVDVPPASWLPPGARVVDERPDAVRVAMEAAVDPLTVLDAARAAGQVRDFALELPTLNDLFLEAVRA
jgi:ABC-2 type transport system ATP-binding protein